MRLSLLGRHGFVVVVDQYSHSCHRCCRSVPFAIDETRILSSCAFSVGEEVVWVCRKRLAVVVFFCFSHCGYCLVRRPKSCRRGLNCRHTRCRCNYLVLATVGSRCCKGDKSRRHHHYCPAPPQVNSNVVMRTRKFVPFPVPLFHCFLVAAAVAVEEVGHLNLSVMMVLALLLPPSGSKVFLSSS